MITETLCAGLYIRCGWDFRVKEKGGDVISKLSHVPSIRKFKQLRVPQEKHMVEI